MYTTADGASSEAKFDDIYRQHVVLLRFIAGRKFRVPPEEIDGLVHDVFATYLTQRENVRNLRAYLVGGICNRCRVFWRERTEEERLFEATPSFEEPTTPDHAEIDEQLSLRIAVGAALAQMNARCRDTLRRFYLEDESTHDIASALGTSPGCVRKALHDCRKRARAIFRDMARDDA